MDPLLSNHSPLSIDLDEQRESIRKPFRFLNYLAQHKDFESRVKNEWKIQGMQGIWRT